MVDENKENAEKLERLNSVIKKYEEQYKTISIYKIKERDYITTQIESTKKMIDELQTIIKETINKIQNETTNYNDKYSCNESFL